MNAIDIARQLAALSQPEGAVKAYGVALHQAGDPGEEMEAALYILQNGGDYKVSYTALVNLYRRDCFREDCLSILIQAFYEPNVKLLKSRYAKNCKLLQKYPWLFRKDFPDFDGLPVRFYPYDDGGYLPFHVGKGRFDDYVNVDRKVISRNFFHDLENPILAKDVYSQYELEYLNDNVRKSEWVGRENHIYLHYTDWGEFCAWLQVLNLKPLLEQKKLVFLIEDEIEQYPIDFKERFGIDYSQYPVRPVSIREVHKLIWHTQLSSHNGGDFFNEILDGHPNLVFVHSIMMERIEERMDELRELLRGLDKDRAKAPQFEAPVFQEVYEMRQRTDKDIFVAAYLSTDYAMASVDPAARIVPAIFFQPHFSNLQYEMFANEKGDTVLYSKQYETVRKSPLFRGFKYIKTFTPMRRITTSCGAAVRFAVTRARATPENEEGKKSIIDDEVAQRTLNRSFMVDPQDRLYLDSALVRFEDGKLKPKATFTALAAFLDIPYTESMTYCSKNGERDPESLEGNVRGFDPAAIYRTYDEFINDNERCFIEYFLRDVYEYYGYDFRYYDGGPVDEVRAEELIRGFTTINGFIRELWHDNVLVGSEVKIEGEIPADEIVEKVYESYLDSLIANKDANRLLIAKTLMRGLRFVNLNGQPLRMMKKLELDPALLEQPLYH